MIEKYTPYYEILCLKVVNCFFVNLIRPSVAGAFLKTDYLHNWFKGLGVGKDMVFEKDFDFAFRGPPNKKANQSCLVSI